MRKKEGMRTQKYDIQKKTTTDGKKDNAGIYGKKEGIGRQKTEKDRTTDRKTQQQTERKSQ